MRFLVHRPVSQSAVFGSFRKSDPAFPIGFLIRAAFQCSHIHGQGIQLGSDLFKRVVHLALAVALVPKRAQVEKSIVPFADVCGRTGRKRVDLVYFKILLVFRYKVAETLV